VLDKKEVKWRGGGRGEGNEKELKHTTARSLVDYNTFNTLCTGHSRLHTLKFLKVLLCAHPYPNDRYFLEEYKNIWHKDFLTFKLFYILSGKKRLTHKNWG
jgi:hypothetical protein